MSEQTKPNQSGPDSWPDGAIARENSDAFDSGTDDTDRWTVRRDVSDWDTRKMTTEEVARAMAAGKPTADMPAVSPAPVQPSTDSGENGGQH